MLCVFSYSLQSGISHRAFVFEKAKQFHKSDMPYSLNLEFRGGAELLFDGIKDHRVTLPDLDTQWTVRQLLVWIRDNMLKQRTDMFLQGCTVRPGILVLINNTDWELCGELNYCLCDNDTVLFISTLHGG